jgi:probable rRNA maturation factor
MNDLGGRNEASLAGNGLVLEIVLSSAVPAHGLGLREAIASSILKANELAGPACGLVTVLVDDDARVQSLNKLWRGIDQPTNVLSFAYPDNQPGPDKCIGDIAISCETAAREAAAERKPLTHHVAHLSVHGFLHLLGYDHQSDDDAAEMEQLERAILGRVDVPDPYIAHAAED